MFLSYTADTSRQQLQEQRMTVHLAGSSSSFLINKKEKEVCLVPWLEEYNCLDSV